MAGLHETFYGGKEPGWIIGRSDPQIPVPFDRHPQYYYSCGCPGNSYTGTTQVPAELPPDSGENRVQEYVEVVELLIPVCCDAFVQEIHKRFGALEGVTCVDVNQETSKVTVRGTVKLHAILTKAQKLKSNSAIWKD